MHFSNNTYRYYLIFLSIVFLAPVSNIYSQDTIRFPYSFSFKELSEVNVVTGSLKEENILSSPTNVTIITKKTIDERGYQTLVDVCQDIPGFDFLVYNDGGGEYPTYNMNRGIGSIGNSKILVMLDGVVQNNISFNWSSLWTYENMLIDVDRIEVIQGPGSVLYGAQAFSGIIHIITKSNFSGAEVKTFYGSNFTLGTDIFIGKKFKNNVNLSFSLHKYHSDGDIGNRYDPGNYFHGNKYPDTILQDYDSDGNYVTNIANPIGGTSIPDGFNTVNDSYSLRFKGEYKDTELNAFLWEYDKGIASSYAPYEYNLLGKNSKTKSRAYHILLKNKVKLKPKIILKSNAVFRATHILPKTGFSYHYRFPELTKSYISYAYQSYIEEKLYYKLKKDNVLLFGIKGTYNSKSERIVSLGVFPASKTTTLSSWDIANSGAGLHIEKTYSPINVYETASYLLWDNKWNDYISSSIGLRYDYSTEFGNVLNPRLTLVYRAKNGFGTKLLYGTAYRQPSIFELTSEFRGNPNLIPEKIKTIEIETSALLFENKLALKSNIFYSSMNNFIDEVEDTTMLSGERFENVGSPEIVGFSLSGIIYITKNIRFNTNYNYIVGNFSDTTKWFAIERTAQHKINAGINTHFLKDKLIIDLRMNYVGKRKAQETNTWLQIYENGFAPNYKKININITYKLTEQIKAQLTINNALNEQYYGIGREAGSGFIDDYDYRTNPNPDGFVPAYHPQPGRTINLSLSFKL